MELPSDAYFAGIFDGEGCVRVVKRYYNCHLIVTNSYKPILELFKQRFGGNIHKQWKEENKPVYYWYIQSKKAKLSCLIALLPHLIIKKKVALIGLGITVLTNDVGGDHNNIMPYQQRDDLVEVLSLLNQKGEKAFNTSEEIEKDFCLGIENLYQLEKNYEKTKYTTNKPTDSK